MTKTIAAHTNPGATYPGYINFTREDDGSVTVHVRADAVQYEGSYICGYRVHKGQPGRCSPGDDRCNNYCNKAPDKGPKRGSPTKAIFTKEGPHAFLKLSAQQFRELLNELNDRFK